MDKVTYRKNAGDMLYLTKCAILGKIPSKDRIANMDLQALFEVCQKHILTACTAYALESAGVYDENFKQAKNKAIRKNILLDSERKIILSRLEQEKIWYMPLKGSILKDLYPQIGMRQMADNDILFDSSRATDVKQIMESLGFTTEHFGQGNHDVYFKPPVCNFEMHTGLFGAAHETNSYEYYKNVKDRLIKDESNDYGYHFSNEDFYVYITAHEYKHYSGGGTGLRSVVDTYVYLNEFAGRLDMEYIESECEKIGIADFEQKNRSLALDLFGGKKLTDEEKSMLRYFMFSGTYGTIENSVKNRMKKNGGGKLGYILSRLLPPIRKSDPRYATMASFYPWYYENRLRLPLLFFYRLVKKIPENRKKVKSELRVLIKKI